ncbi:hypothetical protein BS50DRAFT_136433 [Corynespora cassiicola Philippines]|uniref:Uncharacterized protein n=1 Tax=Corynespora cassiicola Philippines TaxID=1448308 RepID=A0A2T2N9I1_CORCC|nr:hypothetical protein BS50DRAFT_136433 [Corynespora cassiicola Philippines]
MPCHERKRQSQRPKPKGWIAFLGAGIRGFGSNDLLFSRSPRRFSSIASGLGAGLPQMDRRTWVSSCDDGFTAGPSETSRERPSTTRAPNTAPSSDGLNLMNLQLHSHVSCHIAVGIGTAFETPTCPAGAGQGTPTPHILCLQAIANHRKCGTRSFSHRNG